MGDGGARRGNGPRDGSREVTQDRAAKAGARGGSSQRAYDIVLYGATGFVGVLTAGYLAEHAPKGLRWALAGRSLPKLKRLRDQLAADRPELANLPLLQAAADDRAALRDIADHARVVATTVGPYVTYGQELVAACAEAGTDCLDLSGEPEFVDLTYVRHDARARETGARLVHACGFDSVPHDLGVLFTVGQLPDGVPLRIDGYVSTNARFSGGTFASALTAFSRGQQTLEAARDRRRHEPRPVGRRAYAPLGRPHFSGELGAWGVPLPTVDPQIVQQSARALARYGPDFRYRHYAAVRRLPVAVGGAAALGTLVAAAQLPPARRWLSDRLQPGDGPDKERRDRSWFSVRFVGEGGGERVYTEVAGGDPGYDETAKMFAEAAMCLALDDVPATAGQVTPAVAMGDALTDRLRAAGITFRVAAKR
ncbi:saccharopine dehydrogenase [Streptomyces triticagri]|uniref:Saccharopine dehydrogenase n=1 Tax=Streptomyces triticagri TaxID=2293568 RepID=A0A372M8J2_9ACTN|nr:saccharopine dehydrogenase NADP-binding domain-containing protein [Streptomyces triticagri]RFU87201.1 saccharopine dehydrogenase [Streptomyces triticagri]